MTGKKVAVCAGVNYKGSAYQLNGCEVDAANIGRWLGNAGFAVKTLTATIAETREDRTLFPTLRNIIAAIKAVAADPSVTQFVFYYAGHGAQMRDLTGEEADGLDEFLVCQSERGPSFIPANTDYFLDDDLVKLLQAQFRGRDIDVTLVFDACHSGTVCDFGYELAKGGNSWRRDPKARGLIANPGDKYRMISISAASDSECALETAGGGNMTNKFLNLLRAGRTSIQALAAGFAEMSFQTPMINAISMYDLNTKFGELAIGGVRSAVPADATRKPKGASVTTQSGSRTAYDVAMDMKTRNSK